MKADTAKPLLENRKARHDYIVLETLEAGIELTGNEVKSARSGRGSIAGSYVQALGGELWLVGCFLETGSGFSRGNERRNRKLLCHKREIARIRRMTEAKGLSAVPTKAYDRNGKIKLEIAVVRGKNAGDKRTAARNRETEREIRRAALDGMQ